MVTVRGIEGVLITAESYAVLLKAIKNEVANYDGFQPSMTIVDEKRAIVYHREIPDEVPEEPWANRFCCECTEYDMRGGCPFKEGRVALMMNACHHFTIELKGDDTDEV